MLCLHIQISGSNRLCVALYDMDVCMQTYVVSDQTGRGLRKLLKGFNFKVCVCAGVYNCTIGLPYHMCRIAVACILPWKFATNQSGAAAVGLQPYCFENGSKRRVITLIVFSSLDQQPTIHDRSNTSSNTITPPHTARGAGHNLARTNTLCLFREQTLNTSWCLSNWGSLRTPSMYTRAHSSASGRDLLALTRHQWISIACSSSFLPKFRVNSRLCPHPVYKSSIY